HACRPWLDAEIEAIQPRLIVCLGATAAQGLLGTMFKITQSHGHVETTSGSPPVIATLHPSAILRARTSEDRKQKRKIFAGDLHKAAKFVKKAVEK
ncbi:MAG: uracil-DNA glycosylase family protein, partial [Terracidiphilus sp.]